MPLSNLKAALPTDKAAVEEAVSTAKRGGGGVRKAMEALAVVDNNVQRLIREKVLGLSDADVDPQGVRAILGSTVFRPNRMAPDGPYKATTPGVTEDIATLLAARALQAGALTGVGVGAYQGVDALRQLIAQEEMQKSTP